MAGGRLRRVIILLILSRCAAKKSKLEQDCEDLHASGTKAAYLWNACFVWGTWGYWPIVSTTCNHFENGHLAALVTQDMVDAVLAIMGDWGVFDFWTGATQFDKLAEPSGNWEWNLANGRKVRALVSLGQAGWSNLDNWGGVDDCGTIWLTSPELSGLTDAACAVIAFQPAGLCQYDETKKQRLYKRKLFDHVGHSDGRLSESYEMSQISCAKMCSRDHMCHSFAYKNDDGHCLLNQDDGRNAAFAPQASQGYDLLVWELA